MFEYGPHCNGCDTKCKIDIENVSETRIGEQKVPNHKRLDTNQQLLHTYQICIKLCQYYGNKSKTPKTFAPKQKVYCDGCEQNCVITCDEKYWLLINDQHFPGTHHSKYDALLQGLQITKLCKHRTTR